MRYLPLSKNDRESMLGTIGVGSVDDLYKGLPVSPPMDLPDHQSEIEVERFMTALAAKNDPASDRPFFLGAGVYYHHIPATVDYIIQRSEFLTSYTPYQPEMAQGTLQVIFEYQTMVARLTGQDIANASMYDGATACAEAALMAMRITGREKIVVGNELHPHYREVLESYIGKEHLNSDENENVAAIIIQTPDFFGTPHAYEDWRKKCDAIGAKLIVVITEVVALGMLPAPSLADIVCGEAQSIGIPMSYGGPHLGFFACKKEYLRQMPGRLCGETVDADGRCGYVLTLSTREQHIRREKATSNICTNQGLCALAFTVHAALLGEDGLKHLAALNHERACQLADALTETGKVRVVNQSFFNEFVIEVEGKDAASIVDQLARQGIIAGYPVGQNRLLVTATEMTTPESISLFAQALKAI